MKETLLFTDHILEHDQELFIFELLGAALRNVTLGTIAHNSENIVGGLALQKIHSTFLSKLTKSKSYFDRLKWLVPAAAQSFQIPSDTKTIISFSRGLGHLVGFQKKNRQHISYIFEWPHFKGFFAGPLLNQKKKEALQTVDRLFISSEALKRFILDTESLSPDIRKKIEDAIVFHPVFKTEDYPYEVTNSLKTESLSLLVEGEGCSVENAEKLASIGKIHHLKVKFWNKTEHLKSLEKNEGIELLGERCAGDFHHFCQEALLVLSFKQNTFPFSLLAAACCGRPIVSFDSTFNREFLSSKLGFFVTQKNWDKELSELLQSNQLEQFSPHELRRNALRYNERAFKAHFAKLVS